MQKSRNDIILVIDFFHDASVNIRIEAPKFARGKDGRLVKNDLKKFSRPQLEMLTVWFLAKKPKLQSKIGMMFSAKLLEELEKKIKSPSFWKELDEIFEEHYPRQISLLGLKNNNDTTKRK